MPPAETRGIKWDSQFAFCGVQIQPPPQYARAITWSHAAIGAHVLAFIQPLCEPLQ